MEPGLEKSPNCTGVHSENGRIIPFNLGQKERKNSSLKYILGKCSHYETNLYLSPQPSFAFQSKIQANKICQKFEKHLMETLKRVIPSYTGGEQIGSGDGKINNFWVGIGETRYNNFSFIQNFVIM